jgi:hypothetical protein
MQQTLIIVFKYMYVISSIFFTDYLLSSSMGTLVGLFGGEINVDDDCDVVSSSDVIVEREEDLARFGVEIR